MDRGGQFTVNLNLGLSEDLKALLCKVFDNHALLTQIGQKLDSLEKHMATQDEQIAAFEKQANEKLAGLGTSLDSMAASQTNIAADEKKILDQLTALPQGELSPANQAKLKGVIDTLTTVVQRSSDQATAFQALADSLPDVQPPVA